MSELIKQLEKQFNISDVTIIKSFQTFFTVDTLKLLPLITTLKENNGFSVLVFLTVVDWIEDDKFQLSYIVNNPEKRIDLGIRVFINRNEAAMESIHHMWVHAATFQREIKEMYGIDFPGSPRINEPFLLEGWDNIPPMRREFDTKKYSEETFFPREGRKSNDPATFMKQKLYPDEQ